MPRQALGGKGSLGGFPSAVGCGAALGEMLSPLPTWGGPMCPGRAGFSFFLLVPGATSISVTSAVSRVAFGSSGRIHHR